MASTSSTTIDQSQPREYKCEIFGLTFANQNDRDKHIELEHEKNKSPSEVR
jgi:hypothetical protein